MLLINTYIYNDTARECSGELASGNATVCCGTNDPFIMDDLPIKKSAFFPIWGFPKIGDSPKSWVSILKWLNVYDLGMSTFRKPLYFP
jgi:hypothetical protein